MSILSSITAVITELIVLTMQKICTEPHINTEHANIDIYYTNMYCCRVQWCDLLHCGNVILPKAKITPEILIFPEGLL